MPLCTNEHCIGGYLIIAEVISIKSLKAEREAFCAIYRQALEL